MANAAGYKEGYILSHGTEHIEVVYDFSVDGGATGSLNLFKAKEAMVVESCYAKVKTAGQSLGSATVEFGIAGGDTDALITATVGALANLTAGATLQQASTAPALKLAADDAIAIKISAAALTAGKIVLVLKLAQF